MEPNLHLEAVFRQLAEQHTENPPSREAADELARAVTLVLGEEGAEEWAGVLDDAVHRFEGRASGSAEELAEGPGQSGGAL